MLSYTVIADMAVGKAIKLKLIEEGNPSIELARLTSEPTIIGREPDNGVRIPSEAVSREHGVFIPFRGHWLYRDLGSTNGSWINGNQVASGVVRIVRPGDVVQFADRLVEIVADWDSSAAGFASVRSRSLIVLSRGDPLDEYPVPEIGRALVIGGTMADLRLDVDIYELPSLVIERRDSRVCAFTIAKETTAYYNGEEVLRTVNLNDRDEVTIDHYRVIYNDPIVPNTGAENIADSPQTIDMARAEMAKGLASKSTRHLPFGRSGSEAQNFQANETVMLSAGGPKKIVRQDAHPAMRGAVNEPPPTLDVLEDKIIIFVGSLLLVALMVLLFWWIAT